MLPKTDEKIKLLDENLHAKNSINEANKTIKKTPKNKNNLEPV